MMTYGLCKSLREDSSVAPDPEGKLAPGGTALTGELRA